MRGASKKLWSFPTGSGHRGSTISYSVNGRQYIATPSGWGSAVSGLMGQLWPEAEQFRNGSTLIMAVFQTAYVAEGEEGKDKRKRLKYGGLSR